MKELLSSCLSYSLWIQDSKIVSRSNSLLFVSDGETLYRPSSDLIHDAIFDAIARKEVSQRECEGAPESSESRERASRRDVWMAKRNTTSLLASKSKVCLISIILRVLSCLRQIPMNLLIISTKLLTKRLCQLTRYSRVSIEQGRRRFSG